MYPDLNERDTLLSLPHVWLWHRRRRRAVRIDTVAGGGEAFGRHGLGAGSGATVDGVGCVGRAVGTGACAGGSPGVYAGEGRLSCLL